jgi:ribosomal protein L13E
MALRTAIVTSSDRAIDKATTIGIQVDSTRKSVSASA